MLSPEEEHRVRHVALQHAVLGLRRALETEGFEEHCDEVLGRRLSPEEQDQMQKVAGRVADWIEHRDMRLLP